MRTRLMDLLAIDIPVIQAPMGCIARAQLASAVSNAGGLGIIETSSGRARRRARARSRRCAISPTSPWASTSRRLFVRDPAIVDFVVEQGVRFVTTSAGDPRQYTCRSSRTRGSRSSTSCRRCAAALKAVAAGVDGLVVEGGEGGGFKNPLATSHHGAAAAGLLEGRRAGHRRRRHLRRRVHGRGVRARGRGRADGHAHGVGGRVAGARQLEAGDRRRRRDRHRDRSIASASPRSARAAHREDHRARAPGARRLRRLRDLVQTLYFGGDMEASFAFAGQVAGRITSIRPVAEILREAWTDCQARLAEMGARVTLS